jgi:thioredoxin reductase (NADPH)
MIHQTDVAIIGAGPVGLFAVFQCGMLGFKSHVIDALPQIGGQCSALYPEKPIYDIPGYPQIKAIDLIDALTEQAKVFNPVYHLGEQVVSLEKLEDGSFYLTTNKQTHIKAKAILLAAGVGAFGPNRPPLKDIENYEEKSVFYTVLRPHLFEGKKIVIAGGGDSAVDWAIALSALAQKVYLVHRRDKFRAAPASLEKIKDLHKQGSIELVVPYQLTDLEGENGILQKVWVESLEGEKRALEADCLLPFYGLSMTLGPILEWGLNMEKSHIAIVPNTCETNIKGIYAIGDIATYPHKLKLILCGFSEAALAAHAIYNLIHPDKPLHFEYSTTKGLPS